MSAVITNMFRSKQNKITQKAQNVKTEKKDSQFKPYKERKLFFHQPGKKLLANS